MTLEFSKETFDYICQLVGPYLSRQNTRFRKAIPVNKRIGIAMWRLGTGNSYRTTGITFGQGKSTVIKICEDFMETLIRHKNEFIKFPEDTRDVEQCYKKNGRYRWLSKYSWSNRRIPYYQLKHLTLTMKTTLTGSKTTPLIFKVLWMLTESSLMLALDGLGVFMTREFCDLAHCTGELRIMSF